MPSNVFSKENSKFDVSVTRGIWTTGNSLDDGAGAGAAANLDDRRNCVKGVGAGEWGTSLFMPKCVASGSGSSTRWAPKSMIDGGAAPLGRLGRLPLCCGCGGCPAWSVSGPTAGSMSPLGVATGPGRFQGCLAARLPPLSRTLGVGMGCCGRRPGGISIDDRGGLATRGRDSDRTKTDNALRAGRALGARERGHPTRLYRRHRAARSCK